MTTKRSSKSEEVPVSHSIVPVAGADYGRLLSDISGMLEEARRAAVRAANKLLAPTYWEIGRRIVEHEQSGASRAEYGEALIERLAKDLTARHGRGFSIQGIYKMRGFYLGWQILPTPSGKSQAKAIPPTPSGKSDIGKLLAPSAKSKQALVPVSAPIRQGVIPVDAFPLSWSQYVRLLAVENPKARAFYEEQAIHGGWTVRQLDRQISTQFFERALHSKNPQALLARAQIPQQEDLLPVEAEIRDPYLLEFLNLKDEYSEVELEEALIRHMEWFLLEMGAAFAFVARQKRLRVGDSWYRIDLLLYHRGLRCLVVIDLKTGAFTHADAGQMNLYLNYAKEHLTMPGEADPVGIILCSDKDDAVVKYATSGIQTKVFASKYLTSLPNEESLRQEILKAQRLLMARRKESTGGKT